MHFIYGEISINLESCQTNESRKFPILHIQEFDQEKKEKKNVMIGFCLVFVAALLYRPRSLRLEVMDGRKEPRSPLVPRSG
jgi:hypothetical protein